MEERGGEGVGVGAEEGERGGGGGGKEEEESEEGRGREGGARLEGPLLGTTGAMVGRAGEETEEGGTGGGREGGRGLEGVEGEEELLARGWGGFFPGDFETTLAGAD